MHKIRSGRAVVAVASYPGNEPGYEAMAAVASYPGNEPGYEAMVAVASYPGNEPGYEAMAADGLATMKEAVVKLIG